MNGNTAAIKNFGAAADARAGVVVAVSRASDVQRAGAAGLGVDGQAVASRHHNAFYRCEGAAVRQNQVYLPGDGDGFGNGDGAVYRIPARIPCDRFGAAFNRRTVCGFVHIVHLAAIP